MCYVSVQTMEQSYTKALEIQYFRSRTGLGSSKWIGCNCYIFLWISRKPSARPLRLDGAGSTQIRSFLDHIGDAVNSRNPNNSYQEASFGQTDRQAQDQRLTRALEKRTYRRFACAVRVSVEIPFLPDIFFGARNLSRKGMFLTFPDGCASKHNFGDDLVGKRKHLTILFAILLHGTRHHCHVRARIVRVTQRGIAVEFGDHNPWQLAKLVDAYTRANSDIDIA